MQLEEDSEASVDHDNNVHGGGGGGGEGSGGEGGGGQGGGGEGGEGDGVLASGAAVAGGEAGPPDGAGGVTSQPEAKPGPKPGPKPDPCARCCASLRKLGDKLHVRLRAWLMEARDPALFGWRGSPGEAPASRRQESLPQLLVQVLLSCTRGLVWVVLIVNHAVSGSLLSLPYPIACFCYGALESPQPNKIFFSVLLWYTLLLMGLKMAYQLPIVCGSPALTFRASVDDGQGGTLAFCNGDMGGGTVALPSRKDYILGLHKYDGPSSLQGNVGLFVGLLPDLLVLLLLLLHREMLHLRGGVRLGEGTHAPVPARVAARAVPPASGPGSAAAAGDHRCYDGDGGGGGGGGGGDGSDDGGGAGGGGGWVATAAGWEWMTAAAAAGGDGGGDGGGGGASAAASSGSLTAPPTCAAQCAACVAPARAAAGACAAAVSAQLRAFWGRLMPPASDAKGARGPPPTSASLTPPLSPRLS